MAWRHAVIYVAWLRWSAQNEIQNDGIGSPSVIKLGNKRNWKMYLKDSSVVFQPIVLKVDF